MKEKPILFSAPMVCAILEGRKTQTRRILNLSNGQYMPPSERKDQNGWRQMLRLCPYGPPGTRLWVREAFSGPACMDTAPPSKWGRLSRIWYWADGNPEYGDWTRPKPSIHMPRWASRITLEVIGVRVELLQDISEADARAEGIYLCQPEGACGGYKFARGEQEFDTTKEAYADLWEQINGPGSWAVDPWVWVIDFRRPEGEAPK